MEDIINNLTIFVSDIFSVESKWAFLILPTSATLVLALILDWVQGDLKWLFRIIPHPVVFYGKIIAFLDKKLNREDRSANNKMVRGMLVSLFVISIGVCIGLLLEKIAEILPWFWILNIWLTAVMLAGRSLYTHVRAVATGFAKSGLDGGREAVGHIVGRDPKTLDKHGVIRAAIESLAENFADGVVAPAFWYLLFGLPGILGYKAVNTLDSMIGYRTKRHKDFGMFAARLDDLVNWLPARISGCMIVIAAFLHPNSNPFRAMKIMWIDSSKHASPNAGWPEGAMAGAFNWALGGPRQYPGGVSEAAWIGQGKARLEPNHIGYALDLYAITNVVQAVFVLMVLVGSSI
ncbi:adenosylcobinamide-phosphate synthase CbiB [Curvivirga sp.]|uniref:adenosylcobinamide-phosphate synthase CbiB n=1 Tax=Curvivirga sp. TaxID=2856848 RepID=UPI003B5CDB4C